MGSSLLPLLVVLACSPTSGTTFGSGGADMDPPAGPMHDWYQDWFSSTWELCGRPEEYRPIWPFYCDDCTSTEVLTTQECRDAIMADMKLDLDTLPSPDSGEGDNLSMLGYALLSTPLGTVEELRASYNAGRWVYVRQPFVHFLEELAAGTGEHRVRRLLYNMAMSSMVRTVWVDWEVSEREFWADIDDRTLHLSTYFGVAEGHSAATVLIHEAVHLWKQQAHITCPECCGWAPGEPSCDEDFDGPYGYQAALPELMIPTLMWEEDPYLADWQAGSLDYYGLSIPLRYIIEHECTKEELAELADTGAADTGG